MSTRFCTKGDGFQFLAKFAILPQNANSHKKLHQRDEKHQINQFLADWLRYCLAHGAMAIPVC
ncbi:DUF1249 domain-containing protein [Klebsiella pneumoniae]|uniref:DUF1249 domain-containing protein n=1 Tax=Klebsiella pneumoniae TaxID=573 RepID=UPI00226A2C5A|nr:DUF1249 domain-containing protein [Klebsiella pneumoniae]